MFGLWTVLGLLLSLQTYVSLAGDGRDFTLRQHLYTITAQMYRAWMWAGLTPLVFALRREIGRRHPNLLVAGALHLLAALTIFAVGNVLRLWVLWATFGYFRLEDFSLYIVYNQMGAYSLIDFYIYWVVLMFAHMSDLGAQKRQTELREEQLRTALAQAELAALKQQVQPHFLFNALNAIAALMRAGEAAKAVEALAVLSTLLRQLLNQGGRQEIELRREFDYAQCYLAVEKVRFEEKLIARFEADDDCLDALVPTLILQPLVENAVKHGIAQRRHPGRITISAHRAGDRLRLEVTNDPAEGGHRAHEGDNHGIGLSATRARLERIYNGRHQFNCRFNGPEGTVVSIELPLRFAAAGNPA